MPIESIALAFVSGSDLESMALIHHHVFHLGLMIAQLEMLGCATPPIMATVLHLLALGYGGVVMVY
jgi:hypothetical protein